MTQVRKACIPVFCCVLFLALGTVTRAAGLPEPTGEKLVTTILNKKARPELTSPEVGNVPFTRGVSILTEDGRFLVIPTTRVFNQKGGEIGMEQLPVPCKARLWYQPLHNNNPNVLQIQVLSVQPGAMTAWTKSQPE